MNILLVEDSLVIQQIESALLKKMGHQVTLADSGEKAIPLVATQGFDLILMDMQLGGIDGVETTKRLRLAGCQTPIVAVTGNDSAEDRQICRQAGMNGYLSKPIKPAQLQGVIDRYS